MSDRELKQSVRDQAGLDLNSKLRLEARLRPEVRGIERGLVREVTRSLGITGNLPDVAAISADKLEPVLRKHYAEVGKVFSKRLRGGLPDEVKITEKEAAEIDQALERFFDQRALTQARAIARTNRKNAVQAVSVAERERQRLVDQGEPMLTQREVGLVAGTVFSRRLAGRTTGLVMLETQAPAEASKLTELDVLLGLVPFVNGGVSPGDSERARDVTKEWVSQGDSRVRGIHLSADSGQVPVNQPFLVGGDRLMHPGDTSLGARLGNVVNCRCASLVDVEEVASARMKAAEEAEPVPGPRPTGPEPPNPDAKTSLEKWTDENGVLHPDRQRLHDEIIENATRDAIPKDLKEFHLVGGGPASGKGTAIGSGNVRILPDAVVVNADDIKLQLPEMIKAVRERDFAGAAFTHAESSVISERLMQRSVDRGFNVVLDGTGDGTLDKLTKRVLRFKDKGYRVTADYVTIPTETAVTRSAIRAQQEIRDVPASVVREIHSGVSKVFPKAVDSNLYAEVHLFDTNIPRGLAPRRVFSKVDGIETIHDQSLWDEFLAKGLE